MDAADNGDDSLAVTDGEVAVVAVSGGPSVIDSSPSLSISSFHAIQGIGLRGRVSIHTHTHTHTVT